MAMIKLEFAIEEQAPTSRNPYTLLYHRRRVEPHRRHDVHLHVPRKDSKHSGKCLRQKLERIRKRLALKRASDQKEKKTATTASPQLEEQLKVQEGQDRTIQKEQDPLAAVQAIVYCNAITSPLLRLPVEVRSRILTYAAGGQHIRLEFANQDKPRGPGKLRSRIYADGDFSRVRNEPNKLFSTTRRRKYTWLQTPPFNALPPSPQPYRVLGSICRQIYHETSNPRAQLDAYRFNTFSFANAKVLSAWHVGLSAAQRAAVRRIVYVEGVDGRPKYQVQRRFVGLQAVYVPEGEAEFYVIRERCRKGWEGAGVRSIGFEMGREGRVETLGVEVEFY